MPAPVARNRFSLVLSLAGLALLVAPLAFAAEPADSPARPAKPVPAAEKPVAKPAPAVIINADATTNVYGLEAKGRKFVYIFDRSGSMEGPPLTSAKEQLLGSIDKLGEMQQFQIVFFNHTRRIGDLSGGQNRIPFANDRAKKVAADFVASITADGGTDRYEALLAGISLRPDVIYFLTDVDEPMTADELERIRRKNEGVAEIHVIEYGEGDAKEEDNFLKKIAHDNRGGYKYVDISKLGESKPRESQPGKAPPK